MCCPAAEPRPGQVSEQGAHVSPNWSASWGGAGVSAGHGRRVESANEELRSANEEMQSTNEEMVTSREELQSVNEELVTLNSEHETKIEELTVVECGPGQPADPARYRHHFLDRNCRSDVSTRPRPGSASGGDGPGPPVEPTWRRTCSMTIWLPMPGRYCETRDRQEGRIAAKDGRWYLAHLQMYRAPGPGAGWRDVDLQRHHGAEGSAEPRRATPSMPNAWWRRYATRC